MELDQNLLDFSSTPQKKPSSSEPKAPSLEQAPQPQRAVAPKWADIEAKPEYKALAPEKQAQAKAAYFDYYIVPRVSPEQAASLREQFLAKPVEKTAPEASAGEKILDTAGKAATAVGKYIEGSNSVMDGYTPPAPAPRNEPPVTAEQRAALNAAWDSGTPERRAELEARPDWAGQLARQRAADYAGFDKASTPTTRLLDTRVEGRRQALIGKGEDPRFAEVAAQQGAARGVVPGREVADLQRTTGTIGQSEFDFDTAETFRDTPGLNNPLVRGLTKGGIGIAKASVGVAEAMWDALGGEQPVKNAKAIGDVLRSKEAAIGERGTFLERNLEGAIGSIAQQLPLIIAGTATGSMAVPLAGIAVQTFGQEYSDGKATGQTPAQAVLRASAMAAFEVIGERFGLGEQMAALRAAAKGLPSDQILGFLGRALAKEVPGELLTTTGQAATDKFAPVGIGLNPNMTGEQYLAQVADTIAQTIMQTGLMAGGTTGVSTAVRYLNERGDSERVAAGEAEKAREKALKKFEQLFGGKASGKAPPATPPGPTDPAAPAGGPTQPSTGAADETGQRQETTEEVLSGEGGGDATPDQDVLDFAESRYRQLRRKRDGTTETVMGETGPVDMDVPGAGLTPAEATEMDALEANRNNPQGLRDYYGFDQAQADGGAEDDGVAPLSPLPVDSKKEEPAPVEGLNETDVADINAWLDSIEETDPDTRESVMRGAATDPKARDFYLGEARRLKETASGTQTPETQQAETQGQEEPAAEPVEAAAPASEPPPKTGTVRVYHSGSAGDGKTGRWVSTDRNYASNYRPDLPLYYIDIPAGDPRVNNPDYVNQGAAQGFTFNFELTPQEATQLAEINRKPDAGVAPPSDVAETEETDTEPAIQRPTPVTDKALLDRIENEGDDAPRGFIIEEALAKGNRVFGYSESKDGWFEITNPDQAFGARLADFVLLPAAKPKTEKEAKAKKAKPEVKANTIVSDDEAEKARQILKKKLSGSQLNAGVDPEILQAGIKLATYHIERGARTFAAYAQAMVNDLGDFIKPYLKSWYMGVKYDPAASDIEGLDDAATVERADIEKILRAAATQISDTLDNTNPGYPNKYDLFTPEGKFAIAKEIADYLIGDGKFDSIVDARKFISKLTGNPIAAGTESAKQADETIEVGVVLAGREIVAAGRRQKRSPEIIYDRLVDLYNRQPNLAVRSSTSVRDQAYSTPVPLAYLASELAGITYDSKVLEPTAGNGMLVIGADTRKTSANELNPKRAAMLKELGFRWKSVNAATETLAPAKSQDAVIANPPFGVTKDANGETIIYEVSPSYGTREVDHAIVFNSLEAMKDDGRAVLIVGGVQAESDDARREDYRGKSKRSFYFNLYNAYNVVDHFSVDGSLYSKQGASYPVDVIVIEGRGKSSRDLPAAELPQIITSYDQLKEKLNGANRVGTAPGVGTAGVDGGTDQAGQGDGAGMVGGTGRPGNEPGTDGAVRGNDAGVPGTRAAGDRRPAGSWAVPSAGQSQPTDAPNAGDGTQGVPGRSAEQPRGEGRNRSDGPANLGGVSQVGGQRVESGLTDRRGQEQETETQVSYKPYSTATSVGTLVPVAMRDSIAASLQKVQDEVGSIDEYVADALKMDLETLRVNFSAEQVDALALSIRNAAAGRGFIIGDQTGIGKGRVVAAMIRYALVNGKTPIFVTEKPNLYSDMIRDLDDIGMTNELSLDTKNPRIFITNSGETIPYSIIRDVKGEIVETQLTLKPPARGKALDQLMGGMAQEGKLTGGYKVIFTTYNQLQTVKGKMTERMKFIQAIGNSNYMIFDESHNAGGAGETQARTAGQRQAAKEGESLVTGRAAFVRGLVRNAFGTFFSSATYAKRPDVMDLYSSTNMMLAVDKPAQLGEAIKGGGVPMQQVVANMLTADGQYIRRERTFAGVSYDTTETAVDKQTAENMAASLRSILMFSREKEGVIKAMQKELDREGAVAKAMGGETTSVQGANFGSIMHNLIDQMLLSLKVKSSVTHAIERLKAGEKVVLTVSNTMGSFLKDYAEEMGINTGDPVTLSFRDLFNRYLEKQRVITIKEGNGNKTQKRLTDEELGPRLVKMFRDIQAQIDGAGFGDAPISPIDFMHAELKKAGYKTDEITGRDRIIVYDGGLAKLSTRSSDIKQRVNAVRNFNSGATDVLILNQAGSTGLSLHASSKVKDQRKRHMIIVQAEKNIDTHMQMLGRVHRTGQVIPPAYSQMMADIPAEMRPAAVLLKKMASLNANTTASRKSSVTAEGVVDFMNDYGGQVVQEYLRDNPDVHVAIGGNKVLPLVEDSQEATEDDIRRFTGYVPMLPIKQQEQIYKDLIDRYNELIERENSLGTNKLEAKAVDLDAETISSQPITESKGDPSMFAMPANMERIDVKRTVKPYSRKEVTEIALKALDGKTAEDKQQEQLRDLNERGRKFIADRVAEMQANEADPVKVQSQESLLGAVLANADVILRNYKIGDSISIKDKVQGTVYGVITDITNSGRTANPAAGSSWKMQVALANGDSKTITLNFSQIGTRYELAREGRVQWFNFETQQAESVTIPEIFDNGSTVRREKRWIVTGNILAGFAQYPGQIISYTKKDGTTGQGVLMSRQFDFEKEQKTQPVRLATANDVMRFLNEVGQSPVAGTSDGVLKIVMRGSQYEFQAAGSKREGGTYFLDPELTKAIGNDFYKRGGIMAARAWDEASAKAAVTYLMQGRGEPLYAQTNLEDARRMFGLKNENKSVAEPGATYNQDPYATLQVRPGTTEAQKDQGRAALADLSRRLGIDRLDRRLNDSGGATATILGARLYDGFVAGEANSLVGQQVNNARDLAVLAQVYRDPRYETFRVVYVQGNRVVGEAGYTSRLPAMVSVPSNIEMQINKDMLRFEADGFYLIHNHPSGVARPSNQDVRLTTGLDGATSGMRGHVVIDFNEYAVIKPNGDFTVQRDLTLNAVDFNANPAVPNKLLGRQISNERDLAVLGKELQIQQGHATLVLTNRKGEVQLLVDVPMSALMDTSRQGILKGKALIRRMARDSGSGGFRFIVLPEGAKKPVELNKWVDETVFQDIVSWEPSGAVRSTGRMITGNFMEPESARSYAVAEDEGPQYSPSEMPEKVKNRLVQFFGSRDGKTLKTFGLYDRTLSTQYNKALKDSNYGKVFAYINAMQNHVSLSSIRPAELAPGILPRIDDIGTAASALVRGRRGSKSIEAAAEAIFAGTLAGKTVMEGRVWNEDELRNQFGLDDTGVALYKQARAAIDASLDEVAAAEAYAMVADMLPKNMRRILIDNPQGAMRVLYNELNRQLKMLEASIKAAESKGNEQLVESLNQDRQTHLNIMRSVEAIFSTARNLQAAGYAPLMRFGKYTVTAQAIDPKTGNVLRDENGDPITDFYSQYETEAEAQAVAEMMETRYAGRDDIKVSKGVKSQAAYELYAGISPETLALFAEAVGADAVMKKYYQVALAERSALKRRLERKGTSGYSEDLPRVLANFVTSNGRFASQRFYLRDVNDAIKRVPKEKGDVLDEAMRLKQFMLDPNDAAAPVSSLLFAWYLGGSISAALVNLTQPVLMTGPYLSKYGVKVASESMVKALPYAMGKKQITDYALREALKRAGQEGIVDAQEIFHLYSVGAQGVASQLVNQLARLPVVGGRIKAGSEGARARISAFMTLWGSMFALAEGFNRRLTFIAAWEVAKARGEKNPYAFAVRAVNETQGIYNKVNRPNWARNAGGRIILTFKQYSFMYIELVNRMVRRGGPEGRRAALMMLGILMLLSGEEGLPFAQDLDDLIDTIGQGLGYDTNMRRSKRRLAYEIFGKELGDMFLYGISAYLPLDFQGRLGLGNMIPGTGLLKPSAEGQQAREITEVVGPAGGLVTQVADAYEAAVDRNFGKAAQNLAPKAVRDVLQAGEMASKGYATDYKGRKTVETDALDVASKAVGFNPTKIAQQNRKSMPMAQDMALQKRVETSIVDQWARSASDNDQEGVAEARKRMEDWNARNPDTQIAIQPRQIRDRVRALKTDKDARQLRQAPREMRGRVREGLDAVD